MGREIAKGVQPVLAGIQLTNVEITVSDDADSNKAYWVDTSAGPLTLTLPANPVMGDLIRIFDVANSFDTNNLTLGRNGRPIMSGAEDLTVNTEGAAFDLVYYDNTQGWRVFTI
jgi:hypothetical protein